MDANSKYHISGEERDTAVRGFHNWPEKHASKDAAIAFDAIVMAETISSSFRGCLETEVTDI